MNEREDWTGAQPPSAAPKTEHYGGTANYAALLSLLVSWGLAVQFFIRHEFSVASPQNSFTTASSAGQSA